VRVFLALPLPEEKRTILASGLEALARSSGELSWVKPEGLHITLLFFGEITETQLKESVDRFSGFSFPAFHVRYEGLGQFPKRGKPRVFYAGITEGQREARELYGRVCSRLSGLFTPEARPFTAHITLARVKDWQEPELDPSLADSIRGEFLASRMVFFESLLQPSGAEYRERAVLPLC